VEAAVQESDGSNSEFAVVFAVVDLVVCGGEVELLGKFEG
jgi:hypothetical protein